MYQFVTNLLLLHPSLSCVDAHLIPFDSNTLNQVALYGCIFHPVLILTPSTRLVPSLPPVWTLSSTFFGFENLLWAAPPQGYPCHLMCRRVNIEGLRLLLLEGIVYKFGPWLEPGTLDFRRVPTFLILIRMVHCAQTFCINNVVYPEQLAFLVGIWNFCTYRHGVPLWPTFNKNFGFWILWAFWYITFHTCCHCLLLEELSTFPVIPLRENS